MERGSLITKPRPIEEPITPHTRSEGLKILDQNQEIDPSDQGKKPPVGESSQQLRQQLLKNPQVTERRTSAEELRISIQEPEEQTPESKRNKLQIKFTKPGSNFGELSTDIDKISAFENIRDRRELQNVRGDLSSENFNRDIKQQKLEQNATITELANEIPKEYTGREVLLQAESNYELLSEAIVRVLAHHVIYDKPENRVALDTMHKDIASTGNGNDLQAIITTHLPKDTPSPRALTILYDALIQDNFQAAKQHLEIHTFDHLIESPGADHGKGKEREQGEHIHIIGQLTSLLGEARKTTDALGQNYQRYLTATQKFVEYNGRFFDYLTDKAKYDLDINNDINGIANWRTMAGVYWPNLKSYENKQAINKAVKMPDSIDYTKIAEVPYLRQEQELNVLEDLSPTQAERNTATVARPDEIQPVTNANAESLSYQQKLERAMESFKSKHSGHFSDTFSKNTYPVTGERLKFQVEEIQHTQSEVEESLKTIIRDYQSDSPALKSEKLVDNIKLAARQTKQFTTEGKKIYTALAGQLTKEQKDFEVSIQRGENKRYMELISEARDTASSSSAAFQIFLRNQWQSIALITFAVSIGVGVAVYEIDKNNKQNNAPPIQ